MTLTTDPQSLAAALKGAAAIVNAKDTIPVLSMVRLTSDPEAETLELVTTNLDLQYRQSIKAAGATLSLCVDAKRLLAMASSADPAAPFTLTHADNRLNIKAGKSRWTLPTLPANNFPVMSADGLCKPLSVPDFSEIAALTLWAAATEQARYYLDGVCLNEVGGKACFTATNTNALATADTALKWPAKAPTAIIPRATVQAIAAVEGAVSLSWSERMIVATTGQTEITSKLIEGSFPDYRRIFPEASEPYAVDRADFLAGVRRIRIASDAKERRMRISRTDGALSIRIEGTAGMDGAEDIPADCSEGFDTGVKADELIGMLTALSGAETITIEQAEAEKVMRFRPMTQRTGIEFTGLLMPIRI